MAAAERRVRALVVDDEAPARAVLREYLAEHPDVEVVGECANGFEALKAVAELAPDLLFLDVQMPKLDGFEVLELLEPPPTLAGGELRRVPAVIFVTAYDQYALKAFEVHAVDYLLKPFDAQRLAEALGRARARIGGPPATPAAKLAAAARAPGRPLERVLIRHEGRVQIIPVAKLDYVEAQDDYVAIRAEGRTWLKQQRLADLEVALDPQRFVRVHRSYLLNVERLVRIELYAKDSRVAILGDGTRLPVSRPGHARLKELL